MATTNPTITVASPARTPRLGGIFEVADVIDVADASRLGFAGTVEWQSLPCGIAQLAPGLCFPAEGLDDLDDKEGVGPVFDNGFIVPGYFGVECFIGPNDDSVQQATLGLTGSEDRLLEQALVAAPINMGTPTDPGSAGTLNEAIALADSAADAGYIGMPVLYLSRANAVRAAGDRYLFADGAGGLTTANGTPVLASSAFADDFVWWSGAITVWRTPVATYIGQDLTHNKQLRIAERVYGIGFDCVQPTAFQITAPGGGE